MQNIIKIDKSTRRTIDALRSLYGLGSDNDVITYMRTHGNLENLSDDVIVVDDENLKILDSVIEDWNKIKGSSKIDYARALQWVFRLYLW